MNTNTNVIDYKYLISLVQKRPVIWDKTLESYKHNRKTFLAWREIFELMREDFDKMSFAEREIYGKYIINQWTAMRDTWMKCYKRIKDNKGKNRQSRKCLFFDEMSFLSKILEHQQFPTVTPENTMIVTPIITNYMSLNESVVEEKQCTLQVEKVKEDITVEVDPNEIQFIDNAQKEEESRTMSFFKAIAPTVEKFTDEQMVDFQYEVIKLMRSIQRKNLQSHCICSNTSYGSTNGSLSHTLTNGSNSPLRRSHSESLSASSKSPEFPRPSEINNSTEHLNSKSQFPFYLSESYTIK